MRVAIAGLMVASFLMFLASLYLMFFVLMPGAGTTAFDILTASVFPMISAAVLLLGAAAGYRHSHDAATTTTNAAAS